MREHHILGSPAGTEKAESAAAAPLPRENPIRRLSMVILSPLEQCNCRCLMCDYWRTPGDEIISLEKFESWRQEWQRLGVGRLVITGGEALLHRQLPEMLQLLTSAGIEPTILTSGILLRRRAADLVLHCGNYIVSLDGPPEIHDEIRGVPGAFARLAEGLEALRDQGKPVLIMARCTVQRRNCRQLRRIVDTALALKLNRISFLAVDVSGSSFNSGHNWTRERIRDISLSEADLAALEREIDDLERDYLPAFTYRFIAESPFELRRRLCAYFAALIHGGAFVPGDCNAPWFSAVVQAGGEVRPCFFHPAYGSLDGDATLESIINSPKAVEWRDCLNIGNDPICRRCVCRMSMPAQLW